MTIRKPKPKKKKKKKTSNIYGTKRYPRKGVKPAKISTFGDIEVEYDKDKSGDHYVANMEFGQQLTGKYEIHVDLMGYNHENIENLTIEEHNGMISLIYREKDKDLSEVVIVIRPEKIEEKITPKKKRFGRFSKSEIRYNTKPCGHACDTQNNKCCICRNSNNCYQCKLRQSI